MPDFRHSLECHPAVGCWPGDHGQERTGIAVGAAADALRRLLQEHQFVEARSSHDLAATPRQQPQLATGDHCLGGQWLAAGGVVGRQGAGQPVGQMGRQLAADDAHPQAVGRQPSADTHLEKLLVNKAPEFVVKLHVVRWAADEEQLQKHRLW